MKIAIVSEVKIAVAVVSKMLTPQKFTPQTLILTPKQRHKKRAFTADADNFSNLYLVDALHAIIAIYEVVDKNVIA